MLSLNLAPCRKPALKALKCAQSCSRVCQKETTHTRTSLSWCGVISPNRISTLCITKCWSCHCRGGYGIKALARNTRFTRIPCHLHFSFLCFQAFVYFNNFESCCNFVEDQSRTPVSVKGSVLNVHLVLEQMDPGSSEVCREPGYLNVLNL